MAPATTSRASSPAASPGAARYAKGVELCIRRHVPPKPFGGDYGPSPRGEVVHPEGDFIDRLDFALANPPLDTKPPAGEEHCFTITGTRTLRRQGIDAGSAHVVAGYVDGDPEVVCLAKIYDGLDYSLQDKDSRRDCMTLADRDYAVETWAYEKMQPVATVGSKLVPGYYGAWTFSLDTGRGGQRRWVRMLLLELVEGETMLAKILRATKNGIIQNSLLPNEKWRLAVLKNIIEAEFTIFWDAEIEHMDLEPRNVMVQDDGNAVIIDFNHAMIYPFLYPPHPKYENDKPKLSPNPMIHFWPAAPYTGTLVWPADEGNPWGNWIPQAWFQNIDLAAEWLLDTWGTPPPDKYRPLPDRFLNHPAHAERSPKVLKALERLGRKPAVKK